MQCRNCHRELPEGGASVCPYCATRQDTFILPRGHKQQQGRGKKAKRTQLLSMLSVFLVIAVVCVLIPFLRENNKKAALSEIQQIYEKGDPNDGEKLSAMIGKFKNSYPADTEEHKRLQKLLNEFLGLDEDFDPSAPSPSTDAQAERQREIDRLIAVARETLIDIAALSVSGPNFEDAWNVTLKWKNMSGKTVSELLVTAEAYDKDGNAVVCARRGKSEGYLRMSELTAAGGEPVGYFLNIWYGSGIAGVRVVDMQITFADSTKVYLPPEVCSALWGEMGGP